MEMKLVVGIAVLALQSLALEPSTAHDVGNCVAVALDGFRGVFAGILVFLVVSAVTMHYLAQIQRFLLGIVGYAGRSTRRVIALGLLLLFLLAVLYMADVMARHLLLRSTLKLAVTLTIILLYLWTHNAGMVTIRELVQRSRLQCNLRTFGAALVVRALVGFFGLLAVGFSGRSDDLMVQHRNADSTAQIRSATVALKMGRNYYAT